MDNYFLLLYGNTSLLLGGLLVSGLLDLFFLGLLLDLLGSGLGSTESLVLLNLLGLSVLDLSGSLFSLGLSGL